MFYSVESVKMWRKWLHSYHKIVYKFVLLLHITFLYSGTSWFFIMHSFLRYFSSKLSLPITDESPCPTSGSTGETACVAWRNSMCSYVQKVCWMLLIIWIIRDVSYTSFMGIIWLTALCLKLKICLAKYSTSIFENYFCFAVAIPVLLIDRLAVPFHRGFFCDDQSLMHPYKADTVPLWLLIIVAIGLPLITVRKLYI